MFFNRRQRLISALFFASVTVVAYQNCAKVQFTATDGSLDMASTAACTDPICNDIIQGQAACLFNGQSVAHGTTVVAFLASSVSAGENCQSELRLCQNGTLSGSYNYATCGASEPKSCLFNGQTIPHGGSVQAHLTSTVPAGETCSTESRICQNGILSGSFAYATCQPGAPQSCLFNGQTIAHGSGVMTYLNSSVPFGENCQSQFRLCTNGALSGSYNFNSCTVQGPLACLFNGQTVPSGSIITAYQNSSVPSGQTCVSEPRLCANGTLSGSFSYASCTPEQPKSCLFDGKTIPSGASVVAYRNSSVPQGSVCEPEARTCQNGVLSGSFVFASCSVQSASSCTFNGQTVASGQSVLAYQNSSVPFGQTCVVESRSCSNGILSGSYSHPSCSPGAAASCSFNGQSIAHGQTVTAFLNSSVAFGQTCQSQVRLCNNGSLSGSYQNASCSVGTPSACSFNGQNVAHGQSVTAFSTSTVPFGQSCQSQQRTCSNGSLSGSYTFASCSPGTAASCNFNGQSIAHGGQVVAYQASSVPFGSTCQQQTRTCSNGVLSGSYSWGSCTVAQPLSCQWGGITIAHGQSARAYQSNSVPYGQECVSEMRVCQNGTLSGSYNAATCQPQPAQSCTFNSQTVTSGSSVTAYLASSVPYGQTCQSQQRTCQNGQLSGSYTQSACTVQQPASCTFDGQTVPSGSTVDAYESSNPLFPASCKSEKRTCTNGSLSGSYAFRSCTPTADAGWINSNPGETYQQTCTRAGLYPVVLTQPVYLDSDGRGGTHTTDPNGQYGLCASGESRPNGGHNFDKISYRHGTWNRHTWNPHPGGTITYGQMCYKIGQKQDGDGTDIAVAYYCIRTDMGFNSNSNQNGGMGRPTGETTPPPEYIDNGGGGGA